MTVSFRPRFFDFFIILVLLHRIIGTQRFNQGSGFSSVNICNNQHYTKDYNKINVRRISTCPNFCSILTLEFHTENSCHSTQTNHQMRFPQWPLSTLCTSKRVPFQLYQRIYIFRDQCVCRINNKFIINNTEEILVTWKPRSTKRNYSSSK